MSREFKKCLERGKISNFSPGPRLAEKELKLAREDHKMAVRSLTDKNFRWGIIQSYYSMFHSARSLLYARKFREKSHYCLIESIRVLYCETGRLDFSLLESLHEAKSLREAADYYGDFSEENCRKLVKRAGEFIRKAKILLSEAG